MYIQIRIVPVKPSNRSIDEILAIERLDRLIADGAKLPAGAAVGFSATVAIEQLIRIRVNGPDRSLYCDRKSTKIDWPRGMYRRFR